MEDAVEALHNDELNEVAFEQPQAIRLPDPEDAAAPNPIHYNEANHPDEFEDAVAGARRTPSPVLGLLPDNWPPNRLVLRAVSQDSLDESSQPNLPVSGNSKHSISYANHQHFHRAFDALNVMKSSNTLCDVVLVAGDVEVKGHKTVLAACSPYFHAMFSGFEESRRDRIELREIDGAALELLIDYVYSGDIAVSEENVQVLLPAAGILQLTYVRDVCCEFLESQLHPSNCLGIRAFADLHGCVDLLSKADGYVETHFAEVVECEEFLSLEADQVVKLISSDRIVTPAEEKVFECVISWVSHDVSDRQQHLADLMASVRLPLLQQEYLLQRVEEEPLLKDNAKCKDFLIEALKYHLLDSEKRALFKTPRTRPRKPVDVPVVLLLVGGQSPKAVRSVECFDFKTEKWFNVAELPTRRCRCGLAVIDSKVYAVGGFNGSLRVRTVDVYDPAKDTWTSAASMECRRSTLGVATIAGKIYAVGGFDGSTGLNSAEVYDPKKFEWRMIADMCTRRSSVGVGVLNCLLYAVGGYDGASRQCLSSVERYNPETDSWCTVAEMNARRSGAGIGVIGDLLYAVGGHNGPDVRRSVEVYDPRLDLWRPVADMNLCRRNAGVIAVNSLLYVVGGDDGTANLTSVEVYDPATNTWRMLPAHISLGRSYAGLAVVERPGLH